MYIIHSVNVGSLYQDIVFYSLLALMLYINYRNITGATQKRIYKRHHLNTDK